MYCPNCGKQIENDSKFCRECGKKLTQETSFEHKSSLKPKTDNIELPSIPASFQTKSTEYPQFVIDHKLNPRKKSHKYIIAILFAVVIILSVLFVALLLGSSISNSGSSTTRSSTTKSVSETTATETTPTTSAQDFKTSCKTFPYKDIARQPIKYIGEKVVYTGEIVQVGSESDGLYYARINVTKDEYDSYSDTMYVTYELEENEPKFLENDIVTFYGICEGELSYESIFGEEITIPSVSAKYIELVK